MFVLDLFNTKYEKALRAGAVDKVVSEGGPYDLPGIDYPRSGDAPRRPRPSGSTTPRRHDDDPDFMDPDQRRLRADQARVRKANAEYYAKKNPGMAEGNGRDLTNTPRDQFISRMTPGMDANALRQKVAKIVNSPGFTEDTILQIVDAGDNLSHPAGRYIQQAFYGLQYNLGKEYEDYPERVAEKLLSQFRSMLPPYRVAEATTDMPFGSVTSTPSNQKPYGEPSRQEIWDKNDLVNRQAEAREQKQLTLRYARKHGRQAMEKLWAERTDVRMSVEEILEFLDATVNDPGLTPEEFMGTKGLDEGTTQDSKSWMTSIQQQHPDVKFIQAKMPGAPIMAMVNGKPVAQFDTKKGMAEGAPISGDGGAVDNFKQQMANNTELAYQKGMAEARKKKKKKSSRSMQGYFFPGYGYYGTGDSGEGGGGEGGESVNEFAASGGGDSGNYFQALASAWYNGAFDTGSLEKGIKSKEDVERLLNRGIVAPDGKIRKYAIDYNSNFDGVVISSDDYYEHADYNDQGQEVDSRTGQKWGPYDYMEFGDEELDESAKWRDPKYKGQLYTQEPPDYNDTREYDNARFNPKPKGYPGRKELPGGGEYNRTDPLRRGQGIGRSGIKNNINLSGKRKGLPSRDQITSLKQSIKDISGRHVRANLPEQGVAEAIPLDTLRSTAGTRVKDEVSAKLKQNGPLGRDAEKVKQNGKSVKPGVAEGLVDALKGSWEKVKNFDNPARSNTNTQRYQDLRKQQELKRKQIKNQVPVNELSTNKLAQYKTAAALDAGAADKQGNYERGDKRFAGIIKATKKQFANDLKKHGQQGMAEGSSTASEAVERAILNRIMTQHTDLLMQFGPDKVMQAAEEVAYNVGDVDEIGTSDVSAYVNQVRQILGA